MFDGYMGETVCVHVFGVEVASGQMRRKDGLLLLTCEGLEELA